MRKKIIGVYPSEEIEKYKNLFRILEEAFPVRFVDWRVANLKGIIQFQNDINPTMISESGNLPHYFALQGHPALDNGPCRVSLSHSRFLDSRIRGFCLDDSKIGAISAVPVNAGDEVLATSDGTPIWISRQQGLHRIHVVSLAPEEIDNGTCLREYLRPGRFFCLLTLVHFVREVYADKSWALPPIRACFLLDDPNLHWTSYGHVRYPQLAQHAEEHNYHIAIAMPPIDGWYIHPPTASLFKKYNERLSLLIHGNNHVKEELAKPLSESGMNTMIAQALKRTASFEKRSGIAISRVMAAPHGHCSEEMMKKMLFLGFEAATISKPYPWLPRPPQDRALAGWNPAEFVAGGFPVLPRFRFADSTDDLSLRTFLDQPLIMYGHHSDLASGLEILEKLADKVNRFENVNWISLQEMARSNYVTQKEGSVLTIVMYSRRIRIRIPLDIDHIIVEIPSSHDSIEQELIAIRKSSDPDLKIISGRPFVPIPITISGPVDVSLVRSKYGDPANYPNPPFYAWPIIRRILTEGRDRLAPILTA